MRIVSVSAERDGNLEQRPTQLQFEHRQAVTHTAKGLKEVKPYLDRRIIFKSVIQDAERLNLLVREVRNIVNVMSVTWTRGVLNRRNKLLRSQHSYEIRETGVRQYLHGDEPQDMDKTYNWEGYNRQKQKHTGRSCSHGCSTASAIQGW
jgi:hypothetical protein